MSDQESSDVLGAPPGTSPDPEKTAHGASPRVARASPGGLEVKEVSGRRDVPVMAAEPPPTLVEDASPERRARSKRRERGPVFYAAGFWHRLGAAIVDSALIVPLALLLFAIVSRTVGVGLPQSRHYGVDFWLDLLLAADPALVALLGLLLSIATIYVLIFQIALSCTPGMRILKLRIIDQYGREPSTAQTALRTSGYLAAAATLGLGFIWIGFDSEKRGLHDWLSGTYVVRT